MIALYLGKQEELDDDPKAIPQINITGNLNWMQNTTIFFIMKK